MLARLITLAAALLTVVAPASSDAAANCPPPQLALGRPHIDHVQWQALTGRVLGPTNSLPGVMATPMSYDAKGTRAITVMFEFPAGWSMDKPHYLNSDQELLVLSGEIEIASVAYRAGDYAYLPSGYARHRLRSANGATVLTYYEGEHLAFYTAAPPGMYQPKKLIRRVQSSKLRWKSARDGTQRKLLRRDRATGEETWLVKVGAAAAASSPSRGTATLNASVEEFFLLEGELSTPQGVMKPGAYAWRAPNTAIGPAVSRAGYQAILRSKGGAPGGRPAAETVEFSLDAPYAPCITEALKNSLKPQ
jgi:hypothetical protein